MEPERRSPTTAKETCFFTPSHAATAARGELVARQAAAGGQAERPGTSGDHAAEADGLASQQLPAALDG